MKRNKLAKLQLIIGTLAIIFWLINFITTGILLNKWYIGTDNVTLLLFGIFAIITGRGNLNK